MHGIVILPSGPGSQYTNPHHFMRAVDRQEHGIRRHLLGNPRPDHDLPLPIPPTRSTNPFLIFFSLAKCSIEAGSRSPSSSLSIKNPSIFSFR